MKKTILIMITSFICFSLIFTACGSSTSDNEYGEQKYKSLSDLGVEPYDGSAMSVDINNGVPMFSESELQTEFYNDYGSLDSLGRTTGATVCTDGSTGRSDNSVTDLLSDVSNFFGGVSDDSFKPTGYSSATYDELDGEALLTVEDMIPSWADGEGSVLDNNKLAMTSSCYAECYLRLYLAENNSSAGDTYVVYRVTPVFEGDEPLAQGILIEAQSVGDDSVSICRFIYNAEPGMIIDYETSKATADENYVLVDDEDSILSFVDENGELQTESINSILEGIEEGLISVQDAINIYGEDMLESIESIGSTFGKDIWDIAKRVAANTPDFE